MKIAAIQHDIAWEDGAATRRHLEPMLAGAAASGARLAVVTEMFATGFSLDADRIAEDTDGPTSTWMREQAARHDLWIYGSVPERPPAGGRPRNVGVVVAPDGTTHRYAKIHPFTFAREHEAYDAGADTVTVDIDGLRCSLFICYDLRFADDWWPLAPSTDVYLCCANWPEVRRAHWLALLQARAIENQAFVVGVNRVGEGGGLTYSGDSRIFDPSGEMLAGAARTETVLLADVDKHDVTDPDQVRAVPIAVPHGVRIRTQPATRGGTFAQTLFEPKYPWELDCEVHTLLFDDADKKYKLWYRTKDNYAYAESKDLKSWDRPQRPYKPFEQHTETNLLGIITPESGEPALGDLRSIEEAKLGSGGAFFIDTSAPADQRYKCTFLAHVKPTTVEYASQTGMPLSAMTDPPSKVMFGAVSADGIGWRVLPRPLMLHDADTLTVARYDPLLQRYMMYTRLYELGRRSIGISETTDFARWPLPNNMLSAGAAQSPAVDYYAPAFAIYPGRPEIRTMLVLAYDRSVDGSEIRLATSRDGHSFHFTPGEPVIRDADGQFLSAYPSLVRAPDGRMLAFYEAARVPHKFPRHRFGGSTQYSAIWPADRLAAIEAPEQGEFTTAVMILRGSRIILNMQTERTGGVQVQLRDELFRLVPGKTFAEADNLHGDHTAGAASWSGNADLSEYVGRKIFLNIRIRAGKLFSISATNEGAR